MHNGSRSAGLDVLRAAAVLLVLGRHATALPPGTAPWCEGLLATWTRGGWVGVDLFFVLSGFLISGLLFREHEAHGRIDYGRFLIRRGFKIYPPFWVLVLVTVVLRLVAGRAPAPQQIAAELLYVQNYWPGYLGHTWSLAVEEHFYLLLPLLLIALSRRGQAFAARPFAALPLAASWIAIACLSLRCITASGHVGFAFTEHLFPTHLRIDSLMAGVLLSWLWHCRGLHQRYLPARLRLGAGVLGAALLAPAFVVRLEASWFVNTFGLALFYVGSALVLFAVLGLELRHRLFRWIARVGAHSYSIYLWHIPVRVATDRFVELPPLGAFAVYFAGSLVLGIAMSKLVEVPVLRFRDRLFPSRATASAATAAIVEPRTEPA